MPQMAPIQWMILFLFFLIMTVIMMNKIFFLYIKNMNSSNIPMKNYKSNYWKW